MPRSFVLASSRCIVFLNRASGYLSALLFALVGCSIMYDVILRTLFGLATTWALEASTYFMMTAAFIGMPYALMNAEQIAVDAITNLLPNAAATWLHRLVLSIAMVLFVVIGWEALQMALKSKAIGLTSPTVYIPIWPIQLALVFGCYATAAEAFRQLLVGTKAEAHEGNDLARP